MLTGLAFFFLSLLPAHASGQLVSAAAQCSPGFDWLFSSVNQSPCDVTVELGGVCVAGQFNLTQLDPDNVYLGPTVSNENTCRCSSVYYSLLSACAFCQGHGYIKWSIYSGNCSKIFISTFPQPIPLGVKVPTWAYQNVSTSDIFDINIANKSDGTPSSTTATSSNSSTSRPKSSDMKIGTIAAAVGGLVGLALIGGLVAFCRIWKKKHASKRALKPEVGFNLQPDVTRPTIPGFSAPGTPFQPSDALHLTPFYHPNAINTNPQAGHPMSMGGAPGIYESTPVHLHNSREGYSNWQNPSTMPVTTDRYYNPQRSLSTLPVTTDSYWTQAGPSSVAHSQPATDGYHDSPVPLSVMALQQTGDSRYDDRRSATTRQSSVISSPTANQGTTLNYTESRTRLLPPMYADVVDETSRPQPFPEKQGYESSVAVPVRMQI